MIAIDIGTPPLTIDQIESAFAVSGQVLTLLMHEGTKKQLALLEPQDLLIKPDLSGIATSDFPRVGEAIERGRAAAEARRADLQRFSVSEEEWARYDARRKKAPPRASRQLRHLPDDPAERLAAMDGVLRLALANRAGSAVSELDRSAVIATLPDDLATRVRALGDALDLARFAGQSADFEQELREVVAALEALR